MAMFLLRLPFLPIRAAGVGAKVGYRTGRLVGFRRLTVFAVGVGVGLLVAPVAGRELRSRVRGFAEKQMGRLPDGELATRVRLELGQSPRTWHLPQPAVSVGGGRVTLTGEVPHQSGRHDLERTAAAVKGVTGVENLIAVTGTGRTA